jgi:putative phage-type endonuclease
LKFKEDEMDRQIINPKDKQAWLELRVDDITSTEVSALFGVSPYMTEFELWHRKKNREVVELDPNERMDWGTTVQDSIAAKFARDNGWVIRKMEEYIRVPEFRIGCSFDFSIEGTEPFGLLEVKNVDSLICRKDWIIDGDNVESPPHIELQLQHQFAVSGRTFGFIGALVGGNRGILTRREPDEKVISEIHRRVKTFWASIEADIAPAPDFSRDTATIARIYGYAEPGKVKDVRGDSKFGELMEKYKQASSDEKAASKIKEAIKGEVLMLTGDAEKVIGDLGSISLGTVGPCHVEYDRAGYRMFKMNFKK